MNEQTFISHTLSIKGLFPKNASWYQIPCYQRPYRWTNKEVDQLWEDLWDAFEQEKNVRKKNYFLGTIIVSNLEKKEGIYYDVIDGQQRLISLTILFAVVRDNYPEINEKSTDKTAIKITDIHTAIDNNREAEEGRLFIQPRLEPDDSSGSSFFRYVVKRQGTVKAVDCPKPKPSELKNDESEHNYINTIQSFKKKLTKLKKDKIFDFINFIFNQVKIIKIECKNIDFAMSVFQVINTRGMDLRHSDLIKSFLLMSIQSSSTKKEEERQLKIFMNEWREIEKDAKNAESDMDEMLILYAHYDLGRNPGKDFYLYESLKSHFQNEKPAKTVGKIKKLVRNYKDHIVANTGNRIVYSLRYLQWDNLWKSILLSALQKDYPDFTKLAKLLFRFYYLNWIAGNALAEVKKPSFEVIKYIIENGKSIQDIECILNKQLEDDDVINDALKYLNSRKMKDFSWCKPLLLAVNYHYPLEDRKSYFIKNDKASHVEHVLPRSVENNPKLAGWQRIAKKKIIETYLHSAGNLTLLSGPKNIGASNKPFPEKIKYYRGKSSSDSGTTGFGMTKKIIDMYDKGQKTWDEDTMKERREWFLKRAAKLLEIEKEMKQFLQKNKKPTKTD